MFYKVGVIEICIFAFEGFVCSFLLSLIILFIARSNKELKGAFYHLVLAVFISDFLFTAFHTPMFLLFPRYGLFTDFYKKYQYLGSFAYGWTVIYTTAQYLGQTLIAFNRFTALWFPFYHKKIWSSKWYVAVVIFVPIIYVFHRFFAAGIYDFKEDGRLEVGYVDKEFEKFILMLSSSTYALLASISAGFSILTVAKYFKMRHSLISVPADASVKLLIYSLILFGIQCIRLTYGLIRSLFVNNYIMISIIETSLQYIVVVHAVIASAAIMILSSTTRKTYFVFYFSNCLSFFIKLNDKRKIYSQNLSISITARVMPAPIVSVVQP